MAMRHSASPTCVRTGEEYRPGLRDPPAKGKQDAQPRFTHAKPHHKVSTLQPLPGLQPDPLAGSMVDSPALQSPEPSDPSRGNHAANDRRNMPGLMLGAMGVVF